MASVKFSSLRFILIYFVAFCLVIYSAYVCAQYSVHLIVMPWPNFEKIVRILTVTHKHTWEITKLKMIQ